MAVRRGKDDERWQEVKRKVRTRDRDSDRLLRVLTVKELVILRKNAPAPLLKRLDAAHLFSVGLYPDMMYDENNIVFLNRYSHENLDNMRSPLTGEPLSYEERQQWWARIAGPQWQKVLNCINCN